MRINESHEIRVLLTNGSVVQFTTHELHGLTRSRRTYFFTGIILIFIALSNPVLFPVLPDHAPRVFYWGVGLGVYLLVVWRWAGFAYNYWQRLFKVVPPLFLLSLPLHCGITFTMAILAEILAPIVPTRSPVGPWTYLQNTVIGHCAETIALIWLLPLYRRDIEANASEEEAELEEEGATTVPPAEFVVLNGKSVPLRAIQSVRSAEHYLVVKTVDMTSEYRARMKDFLEQVDELAGIQTHRSFWVSRNEAMELSGAVVKTRSGEDIPVSRGRQPAVREWFHQNGKAH